MIKEMKEAIKDLLPVIVTGIIIIFFIYTQCGTMEENKKKGVELVNTLDNGCNVYKIYDNWDIVYFTDCSGKTSYRYQSGKSTKQREVETTE